MSFKYERLPNICYWCGCLNHVDSDCDLWIESEGKLTKENQAYGAWIRATPYVKGRSSVLKVPGFYAVKKAQKKKVAEAKNVAVPSVLLVDDFLPMVVQEQTEVAAHFQYASNEVSVVSEGEAMIHDGTVLESHDSRESFEERLAEINKDLTRFDKGGGVVLGASKGGNHDGNKVESTTRGAEVLYTAGESTKAKAKLGVEMVTTQTREKEGVLVSVPITQSVFCDISNIMSPRKSSVGVEKVKRVRKKAYARQVENATPRVVKKNTKRLASEGDYSELPNKKRLVSCFGQIKIF